MLNEYKKKCSDYSIQISNLEHRLDEVHEEKETVKRHGKSHEDGKKKL
jgi:hypothetical protein